MARILVIEDEELLQNLIGQILSSEGHEIITAINGDEGIEAAVTQAPDLIITDMSLPKKTGWEVIEELRNKSETADIPIIALTAHDTSEDRTAAYEAGVTSYESKPVDADKLKTRVRRILGD